ncbi:hypothetical protein [Tessaracoccus defluvii]|uniref:PqqD family protein n=1 Tax=Tessaracoccus defluvii TaxID=1285901 RepID=A0A7H0H3D0_9ACTN|nr:hypothetical protein [Tessaracoccus defluvii]QNP55046.1 hypothetical protein H9L22_12285 [Tessaracoccus defluvii]
MRFVTVEPADRLDRDGEALLLYPDELLRLGPLAQALTALAVSPATLAELTAGVVELFGEPEGQDATALVRAAASDLVARGALREEEA